MEDEKSERGGSMKGTHPGIRYIIFDLGNVLIEIHPQRAMAAFSQRCGIPVAEFQKLFLSPLHLQFMKGELTPREFFEQVLKRYPCQLSYTEFYEIWLLILGRLKLGMAALLKEFATTHHLALCSNTDPIHWQAALTANPEMQFFRHRYLSFELKLLKPDPAIFEYILRDLQCSPAECVFIDDTRANIFAAEQIGFRTIHAETSKEIHRMIRNIQQVSN